MRKICYRTKCLRFQSHGSSLRRENTRKKERGKNLRKHPPEKKDAKHLYPYPLHRNNKLQTTCYKLKYYSPYLSKQVNNKLITPHNKPDSTLQLLPSQLSSTLMDRNFKIELGKAGKHFLLSLPGKKKKSLEKQRYNSRKRGKNRFSQRGNSVANGRPRRFTRGAGVGERGRDFVAAHPFRLLFANAAETNERAPGLGE